MQHSYNNVAGASAVYSNAGSFGLAAAERGPASRDFRFRCGRDEYANQSLKLLNHLCPRATSDRIFSTYSPVIVGTETSTNPFFMASSTTSSTTITQSTLAAATGADLVTPTFFIDVAATSAGASKRKHSFDSTELTFELNSDDDDDDNNSDNNSDVRKVPRFAVPKVDYFSFNPNPIGISLDSPALFGDGSELHVPFYNQTLIDGQFDAYLVAAVEQAEDSVAQAEDSASSSDGDYQHAADNSTRKTTTAAAAGAGATSTKKAKRASGSGEDSYRRRRAVNNKSAQQSRLKRKLREQENAERVATLEQENSDLRKRLASLESDLVRLKSVISQRTQQS